MIPNDTRLNAMIAHGTAFLSMNDDAEARELRDALLELREARKALKEIANGDGIYGAQAHEYKQIARDFFAANLRF